MATLPANIRVLFDGYVEEKESGVLRTEFESGPPRQAKFKSRTMRKRSAKLFIEGKQNFIDFETFFSDDLEQGALFFNMTDPVRGTTIEARFVGGVYTAQPMTARLNLWEVSCELENWTT